jgi:hypothetical protein
LAATLNEARDKVWHASLPKTLADYATLWPPVQAAIDAYRRDAMALGVRMHQQDAVVTAHPIMRLAPWLATFVPVANVLDAPFRPAAFAVWHDRAVFHFLTAREDRAQYVAQTRRALRPGGYVIVASFAPEGPTRCSGLDVVRYSPDAMHAEFGEGFRLLAGEREDHRTPSGATQAFVYCLCRVDE